MTNDIEASTLKIIADQLGLGQVYPKDRLIEDLGGDALDTVELVMRLEETFNIQVPDEEVDDIITVQDVINCVIRISQYA